MEGLTWQNSENKTPTVTTVTAWKNEWIYWDVLYMISKTEMFAKRVI